MSLGGVECGNSPRQRQPAGRCLLLYARPLFSAGGGIAQRRAILVILARRGDGLRGVTALLAGHPAVNQLVAVELNAQNVSN